jgi:hypothetical protein
VVKSSGCTTLAASGTSAKSSACTIPAQTTTKTASSTSTTTTATAPKTSDANTLKAGVDAAAALALASAASSAAWAVPNPLAVGAILTAGITLLWPAETVNQGEDELIAKRQAENGGNVQGTEGAGNTEQLPEVKYPGNDPTKSPGEGWEWKGKGVQGESQGSYTNPETGESLHPDLGHSTEGKGIGPHWDYKSPDGRWYRVYPDGTIQPK